MKKIAVLFILLFAVSVWADTQTVQITDTNQDGFYYVSSGTSYFYTLTDNAGLSNDPYLVGSIVGAYGWSGMRSAFYFPITLDAGTVVTSAVLRFQPATSPIPSAGVKCNIRVGKASSVFSDLADYNTKHSAASSAVAWDGASLTAGNWTDTPELASIFNTLSYPLTGVIVFLDDNGSTDMNAYIIQGYGNDPDEAAKLVIKYTTGGGASGRLRLPWRKAN